MLVVDDILQGLSEQIIALIELPSENNEDEENDEDDGEDDETDESEDETDDESDENMTQYNQW